VETKGNIVTSSRSLFRGSGARRPPPTDSARRRGAPATTALPAVGLGGFSFPSERALTPPLESRFVRLVRRADGSEEQIAGATKPIYAVTAEDLGFELVVKATVRPADDDGYGARPQVLVGPASCRLPRSHDAIYLQETRVQGIRERWMTLQAISGRPWVGVARTPRIRAHGDGGAVHGIL
jgi:hypothetical protein